jgi:hypothetical protein
MTPQDLFDIVKPLDNVTQFPDIEYVWNASTTSQKTYRGKLYYIRHLPINGFGTDKWQVEIRDEVNGSMAFFPLNDEDCITIVKSHTTYPSGTCPQCGDRGEWKSLALVCTKGHGVFAG